MQNFVTIPNDFFWYHELIFIGCQRVFQANLEDDIPTLGTRNLEAQNKSNKQKIKKKKNLSTNTSYLNPSEGQDFTFALSKIK